MKKTTYATCMMPLMRFFFLLGILFSNKTLVAQGVLAPTMANPKPIIEVRPVLWANTYYVNGKRIKKSSVELELARHNSTAFEHFKKSDIHNTNGNFFEAFALGVLMYDALGPNSTLWGRENRLKRPWIPMAVGFPMLGLSVTLNYKASRIQRQAIQMYNNGEY
jgi:hypothetical protein